MSGDSKEYGTFQENTMNRKLSRLEKKEISIHPSVETPVDEDTKNGKYL